MDHLNDPQYLVQQKEWMEARYESKKQILREGGERAKSHSPDDLVRITYALKRIEQGQYGLCCNCGCVIAKERLDIIPETPHCVICAMG